MSAIQEQETMPSAHDELCFASYAVLSSTRIGQTRNARVTLATSQFKLWDFRRLKWLLSTVAIGVPIMHETKNYFCRGSLQNIAEIGGRKLVSSYQVVSILFQ
jgi:hypothetical protein